jgi:hypothetical protein
MSANYQNPDEDISNDELLKTGFDGAEIAYKDRQELENSAIEQLMDLKETYSKKAYRTVSRWLKFIAYIIILNSLFKFAPIFFPSYFPNSFSVISDSVLMILIGSTTISVVGLFAIILKGTFTSELIEKLANSNKRAQS